MSENGEQSQPANGGWWIAWILTCTVLAPATALGAIAGLPRMGGLNNPAWLMAGLAVGVLHLFSSIRLSQRRSAWVAVGLIIGGWILMLLSSFIGCLVLVSHSR